MAQKAVCKFESQFNVESAEEAYMEWFWDAFGAVDTDDSKNVPPYPGMYIQTSSTKWKVWLRRYKCR